MHAPVTRDKLERFERLLEEGKRRVARKQQSQYGWYDEEGVRQGGLIAFVRYFWTVLEPETPFVDGWPLWAMCQHLEAVTAGKITRLLINIPPGCMKSLLVNVFWPAWEWGPMGFSSYRYVTFSYSASLTERDNGKFRDLVTCETYRRLYGEGLKGVRLRNKTTLKVHNTRTGWKLASSVGGVGTGERGDRIILDDPHNVKDAESEVVRNETTRWFRESLSSRFNNDQTAFVIIMQRVHSTDVSGVLLEPDQKTGRSLANDLDYVHLLIPMKYDWNLQTYDGQPRETAIGWHDPRWVDPDEAGGIDAAMAACDDELAWPERFSPEAVEKLEAALGPYAWAGQYQQQPAPRGGGLFKRDWWQLWDRPTIEEPIWPAFDYIVASLDSAFTDKEENDPSALTIWGTFELSDDTRLAVPEVDPLTGNIWYSGPRQRIMLMHAWRKHLQFSGPRMERLEHERIFPGLSEEAKRHRNYRYRMRTQEHWGLVEWVRDTCQRFRVHKLLIEAKASGISAAQELANRYGDQNYSIELIPVKGDNKARALACQATFSNELVYTPQKAFSEMVIEEMSLFPRAPHDDLCDSTFQAISHLRARGLANTDEETTAAEIQAVMHRGAPPRPLYPV